MLDYDHLLDYTEWQRQRWHEWFASEGPDALSGSTGPHGDGRLNTIGEIVRHIFSAEKLYVERLNDQPLTNTAVLPADDVEVLFAFGRDSRAALRGFVSSLPAEQLDVSRDLLIGDTIRRLTPRKILAHIVLHEIRHWAQVATLLRLQGKRVDFHDFLRSPVM
jgi:uncharacterized damage-inducible protein DinB